MEQRSDPEDFTIRLSRAEGEALNRSQSVTGSQKHCAPVEAVIRKMICRTDPSDIGKHLSARSSSSVFSVP